VFEVPCVAIGGINPGNAKPLIDAGADFLALCQAVWSVDDPTKVVADFSDLLATA
jgi:thiamine-phosphate pyrophosphorylase